MIQSIAHIVNLLIPLVVGLGVLVFALTSFVLFIGSIILSISGFSNKDYSSLKNFAKVCGKVLLWIFVAIIVFVVIWGLFEISSKTFQ